MASFTCFVNYIKQAQQNSNFGVLSHGELVRTLMQNGMTRAEVDDAVQALNELYKARVRQVKNRSISKQQRAMVNAVYGNTIGGLNPNEAAQLEQIANVMGVPMINEQEMAQLKSWAQLADTREGSEKALIEEKIRNVLAQKNSDYLAKLNSSKIAFKVLLSAGFTVMSYISNQKKILENYFIQRLRMQKSGRGFFSAYPLKSYDKHIAEFAGASAAAVRGVTEERGFWNRFRATMGMGQAALLGPTATLGADLTAYSDALEHSNEREKNGLIGWWRRTDRKVARTGKRWLSSIDTTPKVKLGEIFYFNEFYKKMKEQFPTETEAQIVKRVTDNMFSVSEADAIREAEQQFLNWNIVDKQGVVNTKSPRFKVRVAEIMRRGRDPEIMARAFQTAASKVWQGRMTYPSMKDDPYDLTKFQQRLDSGLGGMIADLLNGLRRTAENAVGSNAFGQNLVFSMFGFINGAAAYWQDFMEHNAIYGGGKYLRLSRMLSKDNKDQRLTQEQRAYLEDKIIEMRGKVLFSLIETAMITLVGLIANNMCRDTGSGKTGGGYTDLVTPDKAVGDKASAENTQMQRPESSISLCGAVSIPLEYMGGFSISNTKMIANLVDQLENKDESYISAVMTAIWLTANPTITPLMDANPSTFGRLSTEFLKASKEGKGYDNFYNIASRELSMAASNMLVRQTPIPNRIIKETSQLAIPYRTYMPAGIEGNPKESVVNFLYQFGIQTVYGMGNVSGINQLSQIFTSTEGKLGRPIFDYRHRPVDMGNLYDGKSISGLSKPFRDLYNRIVEGEPTILYDEKDHFLAINDVNIPWDSRIYTVLHKDEPDKKRLLTDDEYYNYTFAYTKAFGEWFDRQYESLKDLPSKQIRNVVTRRLGDIKRGVISNLERNGNLSAEELYNRVN